MSLAPYVAALGRGPGRSRSLTRVEARAAMEVILAGQAAPEATGALLMLLRFRGETAPEIAGFVEALAGHCAVWAGLPVALDWPSYAAGRSRGAPYFLLSALLLARAGLPVMLHGWNAHLSGANGVEDTARRLSIPIVTEPGAAARALTEAGIFYAPLAAISPALLDLLKLREVLGLRSCMNTVARMLNPSGAATSVQGVFHPSYRDLQTDASALLGRGDLTVIKGGGGEFERHPGKPIELFGLRDGQGLEAVAEPIWTGPSRRLHEPDAPLPDPVALWSGQAADPFAEAIVTGTAALALWTARAVATRAEADTLAGTLWSERHKDLAA